MSTDESQPFESLTAMLAPLLAQQLEGFESVEVRSTLSAGATRQTHEIAIDTGPTGGHEAGRLRAVAQLRITESSSETLPVEAEFELLRAAQRAGAPVASPLACGTLPSTMDSKGNSKGKSNGDNTGAEALISEFCDGETIPRRVLRHLEALGPTAGDALAAEVAVAAAGLHSTTATDLPDTLLDALPSFSPEQYLDHLTELLDQLPTRHPALRFGVEYLRGTDQVRKPPPTPALVHGDFRLGNLAVADGELRAVLDWELAHLGDPMEDLAWLCLRTWRFGNDEAEAGGLASLDVLRNAYTAAGGAWDDAAFSWWTIARLVWWGAILADQAAGFLSGSTTSLVHAASGRRVVEIEYDLLRAIESAAGWRNDRRKTS